MMRGLGKATNFTQKLRGIPCVKECLYIYRLALNDIVSVGTYRRMHASFWINAFVRENVEVTQADYIRENTTSHAKSCLETGTVLPSAHRYCVCHKSVGNSYKSPRKFYSPLFQAKPWRQMLKQEKFSLLYLEKLEKDNLRRIWQLRCCGFICLSLHRNKLYFLSNLLLVYFWYGYKWLLSMLFREL